MNYWFPPETRDVVGALPTRCRLPDSYLIFDIETTGFSRDYDLIVEAGWAITHNRQVIDSGGIILDWTRYMPNDWKFQNWFSERLRKLEDAFIQQGRSYTLTLDRIKAEGVDPLRGLYDYSCLLNEYVSKTRFLAGHGIVKFDCPMLNANFYRYLGYELQWGNCWLWDTGLIEKAVQANVVPYSYELLPDWYKRVEHTFCKAKWNLDKHCAEKYQLASRFQLDMSQAHRAGFDCTLNYALCETYRQIGETVYGQEIRC